MLYFQPNTIYYYNSISRDARWLLLDTQYWRKQRK